MLAPFGKAGKAITLYPHWLSGNYFDRMAVGRDEATRLLINARRLLKLHALFGFRMLLRAVD